jgi:Protein of unknown function (DUF3185)
MIKALCAALLIGGIVLIVFGFQSLHSFGNDVSRFFTGSPTDKTMMLFVGGAIAAAAGLFGLVFAGKR